MTENELDNIDFNALKVLKILGEELNTKRAADRLYITQSGVSKALKKIREQLKDPLFVREGNHLTTTDKCERLLARLPALMETLDELYYSTSSFNPALYTGNITVHINSGLSRPLMSALFERINSEAPYATVIIHSWTAETEFKIKQGIVDIGINYYPLEISKEIIQTQIASSRNLLCCHETNPLLNIKQPSLKDITQYPLVLTQMPDFNRQQSHLIKAMSHNGRKPHIVVRSDKIDVCIDTTRQIPSLLVINEIARKALTDDIRIIDTSHIDGLIDKGIGLCSSYKSIDTPYHHWLSDIVTDCVDQLLSVTPSESATSNMSTFNKVIN